MGQESELLKREVLDSAARWRDSGQELRAYFDRQGWMRSHARQRVFFIGVPQSLMPVDIEALKSQHELVAFVDDAVRGQEVMGRPVIGMGEFLELLNQEPEAMSQALMCSLVDDAYQAALQSQAMAGLGLRLYGLVETLRLFDFHWMYTPYWASLAQILDRLEAFQAVEPHLQDEESRVVLWSVLAARMRGDGSLLRPLHHPYHYFTGTRYADGIIKLGEDEVLVDAGAFDGDTVKHFIQETGGRFRKAYCFEPDSSNYQKLSTYVRRLGLPVEIFDKGLWSFKGELSFLEAGHAGSHMLPPGTKGPGVIQVPVVSLDDVAEEAPTLIKMDIEGSEAEALLGCRRILKDVKPRLAICAYHYPLDIPLLAARVLELNSSYTFRLRHHSPFFWETVLYGE